MELAERVGTAHPGLAAELSALAHLVTEDRWSTAGLDAEQEREAERLGEAIRSQLEAPVATPG